MTHKKVARILPADPIDMGGFPVKQALPTVQVAQVDPYLLVHHARVKPIFDRPAKIQGVGPHPHRGFSPVSFIIEGEVHHRDSWGHNQIAKTGEVQWMHAGAGIIHSERPSQAVIDAKGMQEFVQIWINSPADKKMIPPEYTHVSEEAIVRIPSANELTETKLISGKYGDLVGNFKSQSPLLLLWSKSVLGGRETFTIPEGFNAALYLIKGNVRIEGHGLVDPENLCVFETAGDAVTIEAKTDAEYLILAGMPIDEPLAQHGPFVMNTQTQIMEAMRDYQMGKMGVLIEE